MKVTYNWLKDFVDIKIEPGKLADKLTMAGLEVTSLERKDNDFVFEIEVTSNRPDWLCVIGLAREVAAITGRKLKLPHIVGPRPTQDKSQIFKIDIEDTKDCPLYTARIIKGVKVGPSADWLAKRLELIGCRSINNIVDITNYIMFVWGQPLHAFDLAALTGDTIKVRRAKNGEKIITIDGESKSLGKEILVIADERAPIAVAGVMGGKDSQVKEATRDMLLEAAVFAPALVRSGRQRLGLQSEASYRFERGVDICAVEVASLAAARLIVDTCGAEFTSAKKSGVIKSKSKKLVLASCALENILGKSISFAGAEKILKALDFKVKAKTKNNLTVEVPSYRGDVEEPVDLIEEIARIHGFENIPSTLPAIIPQNYTCDEYDFVFKLKNILAGLGLHEAITYSLWDKNLKGILPLSHDQTAEIINPLNREQETLRTSLLPSLAACVAYNLNQKQEEARIFEIARTYRFIDAHAQEVMKLGIALCGTKNIWSEQGCLKERLGILHLKGILEVVFQRLRIKDFRLEKSSLPEQFEIYCGQAKAGFMLKATKAALEKLDIKHKDLFLLELNLDAISSPIAAGKKFLPLPGYPGIYRDISIIIKEETRADAMLEIVKKRCVGLLQELKILDYYKGKQIPKGFKGLTISCFYRCGERTLTETEINPLHNQVLNLLVGELGAQIR
jgi:phenylalanyl-tRNA synthetase beta chain